MCYTDAMSRGEISSGLNGAKSEPSRGKTLVFAIAIILGIGSLVGAGVGLAGYLQAGSLSLSQTNAIILMAGGGVGLIGSLVIPIIAGTVCQEPKNIENAIASRPSKKMTDSNTPEISIINQVPSSDEPVNPAQAQEERTLAQKRASHSKLEADLINAASKNQLRDVSMVNYSFIMADPQRAAAKQKVADYLVDSSSHEMNQREQFSMAIMLGMAIGDADGAPYEFARFKQEGYQLDEKFNRTVHFNLEPWQWTDDTSMGLCLADMLIENPNLDCVQLLWAFHDWWYHGYNNAFTVGKPRTSVGLGNEISHTLRDACHAFSREDRGEFATQKGNIHASGNGSIMRLAPVAIVARTEQEARSLGSKQSRVTHRGDEAAGCSELLAYMLFHALTYEENDPKKRKEFLFEKIENFESIYPSVNSLARSESAVPNPLQVQENTTRVQEGKKMKDPNENWNWKKPTFTFNKARLAARPDYIGSYSMDGLAMALHCIYTTDSFEAAIKKAARRGGDADTVGAITGQIAAAIYGLSGIPKDWIAGIHKWDRGGEIATRGYLLSQISSLKNS